MNVLEVKNVYKRLGKRDVIKGISFNIEAGHIYGFLGANGAGKTTTIRMLVGLIRPNKGSIKIMGHDITTETEEALKYVGCVVENPELYGFLSAEENLQQFARIYKDLPKERISEVLELVGLTERKKDKVKKYSLGMKQRLGLAQALMNNPKLLILDEPTNGLDPMGIKEFRDILKKISKENGTVVFISSHILAEIEQVCDTVAFINNGVIVSVESMNGKEEQRKDNVVIATKDVKKCEEVLSGLEYVEIIKREENSIIVSLEKDLSSKLIVDLVNKEVNIEEIYKKYQGLEDRFMEIVEGGQK